VLAWVVAILLIFIFMLFILEADFRRNCVNLLQKSGYEGVHYVQCWISHFSLVLIPV